MSELPPMPIPAESERYQILPFSYYGGTAPRNLVICPKHYILRDGILIVSRTDANGVITHTNRAFIATSGYTDAELVGMTHNIIRHPDMPRAVFADMWRTVSNGNEWRGCVKNLRKDGGYYWVQATIQPLFKNGIPYSYTSVRRKTDRETIKKHEALYAEMRQDERR